MTGTPLKLIVYNSDSEIVKELSTTIIPWGLMKRAIRIAKKMGLTSDTTQKKKPEELIQALDDEAIDEMTGLVSDVFYGQTDIEELNAGVEISEMWPVMFQVINRAFREMGTMTGTNSPANPTPPGTAARRKRH